MYYLRVGLEILILIPIFLTSFLFVPFPYFIRLFLGKHLLWLWAYLSLKIFGIRVVIHGKKPKIRKGTVIIANHINYFDIFVLGSLTPTVFLAKKEIQSIPMVGWGAYAVGVIFVDRSSRASGVRSIRDMVKKLKEGATVTIFPEGTTAESEIIRPLRKGAFQTAIMANSPIQVAAISYENFPREVWRDISIGKHLGNNARYPHTVHVVYGETLTPIDSKPDEISGIAEKELNRTFALALKEKNNAEQKKAAALTQRAGFTTNQLE